MSVMEDETEITKWETFATRRTHEIRSHRAPEVPSAFPIRRILMLLTILTVAAVGLNGTTVQMKRPERALAAPAAIVEPQTIPEVAPTTPAFDTGSEVDTDPRTISTRAGRGEDERKVIPPPVPRVEQAIAYAMAQIGDRYRWGAAGPNSFDCSGLVLMAFKQIGISLPHYTGTMIGHGRKISRSEMQRGDIVFPASGHVGIYLGNGMMVHASSSKASVAVGKVYSFYAARRLT